VKWNPHNGLPGWNFHLNCRRPGEERRRKKILYNDRLVLWDIILFLCLCLGENMVEKGASGFKFNQPLPESEGPSAPKKEQIS
jgi:hypothetical protein